ncbi:MAG TPA: hypothetical protein VGR73_04960 [Bryobacteraceae bacterium]|nr:hypothetical protein [Bryobacteraceae bacterium]
MKEQIEGGRAVLDALKAEAFPVAGAFWCRLPDRDYWKLIIASEFVSQFGPLAGYRKVRTILQEQPISSVSPSDIALFSPKDPEYLRLREHGVGLFGRISSGFGLGIPRNTNFEDAWFYL